MEPTQVRFELLNIDLADDLRTRRAACLARASSSGRLGLERDGRLGI
jgi:hypothetical protein